MSKRNGKPRHPDRLKRSTDDDVALAEAVESGFLSVCELHLRMHGTMIRASKSMEKDFKLCCQLRRRHIQGILKHTESEMIALRNLAQWTVSENMKLRGQPDVKIEWGE